MSSKLRVTGLSGIDTETMITQLMQPYKTRVDKASKSLSLLEWRRDAYRETANMLRTFKNNYFNYGKPATNFLSATTFKALGVTQKINGATTDAFSVTTNAETKSGSFSLQVQQLAAGEVRKSTTPVGAAFTGSTQLDFDNLKQDDEFNVTMDGVTKTIKVNKDGKNETEVIDDINQQLKDAFGTEKENGTDVAKTSFILDNTSGKITINTRPGHNLSISDTSANAVQSQTLTGSQKISDLASDISFKVSIGGVEKDVNFSFATGTDIDTDSDSLMSDEEKIAYMNKQLDGTGLTASMDADGKLLLSATASKDITLSNASALGFNNANNTSITTTSVVSRLGFDSGQRNGLNTSKTIGEAFGITTTLPAGYNPGDPLPANYMDLSNFTINGKAISGLNENTTIQEFMNKVNQAGANVTLNYNYTTDTFKLEGSLTGTANNIVMGGAAEEFFTDKMGLDKTSAQDAILVIDGYETTRSTNNLYLPEYEVNIAFDKTTGTQAAGFETVDVKIAGDTDKTIENIKTFVEEYNKMLKTLTDLVTTNRATTPGTTNEYYEPLTEEERAAMTETQIKQWEEKAKQGLLYRDESINNVIDKLRNAIMQPVKLPGGGTISMYDLGISTTSYYDRGQLSIDEDKLRKAVESRPDDVSALFSQSASIGDADNGIAKRIDMAIDSAISQTRNSTGSLVMKAGVVNTAWETDNFMYNSILNQSSLIDKLTRQMDEKENYYYSLFAKMESAVNANNSQLSYLQQQMGISG